MIYLHHATIFTPHRRLENGALLINGNQIAAVGTVDQVSYPPSAQVIDATDMYVAPGFIDLQVNGGFGYDFTADPTTIWPVAARLPQFGVTAFLPTIITSPLTTIAQAQEVIAGGQPADQLGAGPLGLHIEGPFLNPAKKGAHNPAYLRRPALADIADWSAAQGIKLVTLAPELPDALKLVTALVEREVVVSAGHSMATFAQAQAGFTAGITYGTHLFNAMPPLHHREPGLIGALMTEQRVKIGLIADGVHVHAALIQMIWRTVGNERLTLVTDAMAAQGMPAGRYQLGELTATVDKQTVHLTDGTLAGSVLTADAALRNLITFTGCTLSEALPTLTSTPAGLMGLASQKGTLAPGYDADLLLLTPDLRVVMTMIRGKIVYQR